MSILSKIFGDANERYIRSLQPLIDKINSLEPEFEKLSEEELRNKTSEFKKLVAESGSLEAVLTEAFAAVREASKRTLGQRHFDVQLMGGIVLHQGKIAEMRTGEGKTLVATLPAYLNALAGKGVHIVTVHDYLARRDAVWMGQIHNALGLSVGCINHDQSYIYDAEHCHEIQNSKFNSDSRIRTGTFDEQIQNDPFDKTQGHPEQSRTDDNEKLQNERDREDKERDTLGGFRIVHEFLRPVTKKEAYNADITYGTNNEYGFDYLRDNLIQDSLQISQVEHSFAIVDEVDSILIDEARTPLIISAPDTDSTKLYETFSKVVPRLVENTDYNVDEKLKAVTITEAGIEKVERALDISNIYDQGGIRYVHHMEQALKAHVLFKRDRDYVVKDGEVVIVDEFTGRLMPGRRWSEGLHQAVEAKEGVIVQKESRTLATITFQNYFRLYKKLAGMTGTARTSAEEFHKVYNLDVVSVPTNKQMIRRDLPDRIYKTEMGKFKAVAGEIKERHEKGQPVLVGTVSIEKNELLSKLLDREGVRHSILNAKNHEKEAEIIAQAGRFGVVTVATNMAGRGVDIILGGNPQNDLEQSRRVCELGGLHVIGTERHEARRIDDQLRGRAGRQGDPGSSQFFVSTEDDVIRVFGGDRLKNLMETLGVGEEDVIENRFVSNAIAQAQSRIEGHNFDIRKYILEYDDVMNKHREAIYRLRREVLFSTNVRETILGYVLDIINQIVTFHASEDKDEWNVEEIAESVKAFTGRDDMLHSSLIEVTEQKDFHKLAEFVVDYVVKIYEAKERETPLEVMRQLEKFVLLRTIDELWMDHIEEMEHLRDSVRLRAYGQRDPLVEYKIEGQKMFERLQDSIKSQVANLIFKVSLAPTRQQEIRKMEEIRPEVAKSLKSNDQSQNQALDTEPLALSSSNVGRNDPCPCGAINPITGHVYKYKKCGMINAPHHRKS